jgi:2'-5' RNA ligase
LGKVRTFIALDLDEDRLKSELRDFQDKLLSIGADVKLVAPVNIHVTLRFLGEIEEDAVQKVIDLMKEVTFQPFDLELRGVGVFPSISHMNVIWVAMRKGEEELNRIVETIEPGLQRMGIPKDRKGFSPHITVARVRTGRNKQQTARLLEDLSDKDFGSMRVEQIRLKKSILAPGGPVYSTLFEVKAGNSVKY